MLKVISTCLNKGRCLTSYWASNTSINAWFIVYCLIASKMCGWRVCSSYTAFKCTKYFKCHSELVKATGNNVLLYRIFPSQNCYFDLVTLFYLSHIHSPQRLTYNWVCIALCVITVELTALYCSVHALQVAY